MPQIQVLQRDADPGQNQMLDAMKSAAEMQRAREQLDVYKMQVKAQMANTASEAEKVRIERVLKVAELGVKVRERFPIGVPKHLEGPIMEAMKNAAGNDETLMYEGMNKLAGFIMQGGATTEEQSKLGEAALDQALAARIAGGGVQQRSLPTQIGVGSDDIPDAAPMTKQMPVEGDEVSREEVLMPKINRRGVEMVFPKDAAKEVANTTRAKNLEDLESGPLTDTQIRSTVYSESIVDDIGTAMAFLEKTPNLNDAQKAAVDSENPKMAGQDVEELQGALNAARSVLLYLRSGAAVNEPEYQRLRNLTMLQGKSTTNALRDLKRFKRDAGRYLQLIKEGRLAFKDPAEQEDKTVFKIGEFSVKRKAAK